MGTIEHAPTQAHRDAGRPFPAAQWIPTAAALLIGFALGGLVFSGRTPRPVREAAAAVQRPAVHVPAAPTQPAAQVPTPVLELPRVAVAPAPTAPPDPDDSPHEFSGWGSTATELIRLAPGLHTFSMSHGGTSNFIVELFDERGQRIDLLSNEIGMQTLSKAVRIPRAGRYMVNVKADGNWIVNVVVPAGAAAPNAGRTFKQPSAPSPEEIARIDAMATMEQQAEIANRARARGDDAAYREAAHKANEAARKLTGRTIFDDVY